MCKYLLTFEYVHLELHINSFVIRFMTMTAVENLGAG